MLEVVDLLAVDVDFAVEVDFDPPVWLLEDPILLDDVDPAAFDVLVEAGLLADPPLMAPAGGKEGSPFGPRSMFPPLMR